MYERRHPRYDLSIEQGTRAVPDDDQYHVLANGKIILSTRMFDYAKVIYEEQREELRIASGDPDPREIISKETAKRDIQALRKEGVASRERRNRGGGPGGPGGVG